MEGNAINKYVTVGINSFYLAMMSFFIFLAPLDIYSWDEFIKPRNSIISSNFYHFFSRNHNNYSKQFDVIRYWENSNERKMIESFFSGMEAWLLYRVLVLSLQFIFIVAVLIWIWVRFIGILPSSSFKLQDNVICKS